MYAAFDPDPVRLIALIQGGRDHSIHDHSIHAPGGAALAA